MEIKMLNKNDSYWQKTIEFAEQCSWRAGVHFAKKMRDHDFTDFECPIIAIKDHKVIGFCSLVKEDFIPNCNYSPWISFIFVDEAHRGMQVGQQMINKALEHAKTLKMTNVYICTSEDNLYEKYGFSHLDTLKSYADTMEKVLVIDLLEKGSQQ